MGMQLGEAKCDEPGERSYDTYVKAYLEQGCGVDPWNELSEMDKAAWAKIESDIEAQNGEVIQAAVARAEVGVVAKIAMATPGGTELVQRDEKGNYVGVRGKQLIETFICHGCQSCWEMDSDDNVRDTGPHQLIPAKVVTDLYQLKSEVAK